MKISIEELANAPGERLQYKFSVDHEILDIDEDEVEVNGPLLITLSASYSCGKVTLDGRLTARLILMCSRCLKTFSFLLESEFEEEVDVEKTTTLSIENVVRETYFATFPLKPLCDISCKGLCPHCGVDLNGEQCTCRREHIDHRMSVLTKLLEK
jgi:uncharacterized protein